MVYSADQLDASDVKIALGGICQQEDLLKATDNMNATIRQKLEIALKPSHLDIEDLSDGCGLKFRLIIVSDSFDNKTTLASHRLVYEVLKEEMQLIHALEIKTYTPEKWNAIEESEEKDDMLRTENDN
ncbi:unnamed protein product [Wuchereria bancrofti]|uniref:BolA-like protein n=2 Tax=Wuchereria bancrofti TaxID=6293 RepID=A0A3P7EA14_WUCBA|nr:unnamed protein product [Wuchereria bancrofti]